MSTGVLYNGDEVDLEGTAISVDEGEESQEIKPSVLISVEYVNVVAPPDREGHPMSIYGHISFTEDRAKPPVTLFHRDADNPETISPGDAVNCFLTLTEDESDRPLFFRWDYPLYVNIRLYEKIQDGDDTSEDKLITTDTQDVWYGMNIVDMIMYFRVHGKPGFFFQVGYAILIGFRVQVEVRMNRGIQGDSSEQPRFKGVIRACQYLKKHFRSDIMLYMKPWSGSDTTPLVIGSPIPLDRKIVVAPISPCGFLTIEVSLYSSSGHEIAQEILPFPIKPIYGRPFLTNKNFKHTKHLVGNLVSVSITFIDFI